MTKDVAAQKIITACHQAQAGGQSIYGIAGLMTWTGMSHGQVWTGSRRASRRGDAVRDRPRLVRRSVLQGRRHRRVPPMAVARSRYITTAARRIEEMGTAVAAVTGDRRHAPSRSRRTAPSREIDQLVSDLLAAI